MLPRPFRRHGVRFWRMTEWCLAPPVTCGYSTALHLAGADGVDRSPAGAEVVGARFAKENGIVSDADPRAASGTMWRQPARRSASSRFPAVARERNRLSRADALLDVPSLEDAPDKEADSIRVLIAHDHPIFRDGLRELLGKDPRFDVVGEAAHGREAIELARALKPDILLLDLSLAGPDSLEVLRDLSTAAESVRTLLLTSGIEKPDVLRALRLGARGVVPRNATTKLLFKSIRSVMAGQYWIGRDMVADLVQLMTEAPQTATDRPAPQTFGLTDRERDIVGAIIAGYSNRDIAGKFGISEDTVKHHLTNIFNKTGVSNRLELALFVLHHRVV